jgi:hypothetical protein
MREITSVVSEKETKRLPRQHLPIDAGYLVGQVLNKRCVNAVVSAK